MILQIRITTNKNGKRIAYYYGTGLRLHPISIVEAEIAIKTGTLFGKRAEAE
jgi:hypothetical protein